MKRALLGIIFSALALLLVADALLGSVELVGLPVEVRGRRAYAGGRLPVGDAFIAWARSSPPAGPGQRAWEPVSARWFVYFHALSAVLAGVLAWWGWRTVRPVRRRAGGAT